MRSAILMTIVPLAACAGAGTTGSGAPVETPATGTATVAAAPSPEPTKPAPVWADAAAIAGHCKTGLETVATLRAELKGDLPRTVDATLVKYNAMLGALDEAYGIVALMGSVHPNKAERDAAEACEREIQSVISELKLDRGLYDAVATVDVKDADAQTQRFVEKLLREFRRAGVDKDEATRTRLKTLSDEIVKVGQEFGRQIREDVRKIEVDSAAELEGLPKDWIDAHAPNEAGKIVITTNYPDFFPVQNYAKSEKLRRELLIAFNSRGTPANEATLKQLLSLRKEYANLLGYPTWAAYDAEEKMVKTSEKIATFIDDVAKVARPRMNAELKVLEARKRKDLPARDRKKATIELWDRFFYVELVRSEKYGFDAQSARPYFEFSRVTKGLMDLYGELFGVRFVRDETAEVWHPSVLAYDLFDGDAKIARFYLDMHPRDGKYGHAAMFPIETGLEGGRIPVGALVCNFPDPSQGPALMEHTQVVTYFHEFGHLVHHLLARGSPWVNQSGINVEWDFVEAPSQLLEEWAWDPAVLARFATHIETNEPIPAELVSKMRASSEFGVGTHVMRQVFLTALSYQLYVAPKPESLDLGKFEDGLAKKYMPYPPVGNGAHQYANFGHLDGYSSAYYTYQWSLVLAKDIFTRFKAAGLLSTEVARDYREKILAPGGTKDAAQLVKDFLGRDSKLDAYKAWLSGK
jgi:thimet oligopeptidase